MPLFKDRLKSLRKQKDMSQQELANIVKVSKQTISQYERGVRYPDFDNLLALCDTFNVSSDYLLGQSDVTMRYLRETDLQRLSLSEDELCLVLAYRTASDDRKKLALLALGIEEKKDETVSA